MELEIIRLLEGYRALAPLRWRRSRYGGDELPLPPAAAFHLADDLEALGVAIMGLDGWAHVDNDPERIVQDLGVDFFVGDDVLAADDAVQKSVRLVKAFIATQLPERIRFVSFTLDLPSGWYVPLGQVVTP